MVSFSDLERGDTPPNTFSLPPEPPAPLSDVQADKTAYSSALAEQNLRADEGQIDTVNTYSTNKSAILNGQEDAVRSNISALEQSKTVEAAKKGFSDSVQNNDVTTAQGFVNVAKDANTTLHTDAIEFNALDSFRKDTQAADSEQQDKTQALLASSMLANQRKDEAQSKGILDKVSDIYSALQKSANEHGNTLTQDITKGLANSPLAAIKSVSIEFSKLLHGSQLGSSLESALKDYMTTGDLSKVEMFKQVNERLLKNREQLLNVGNIDTGVAGNAATDMGKFIVAFAALHKAIPMTPVGSSALAATRVAGVATLADAAVMDSANSFTKLVTDTFPSTLNPVTKWIGDRDPNSPWEAKAKQAIEGATTNLAVEGAVGLGKMLFSGVKANRTLSLAKEANAPVEKLADNVINLATVQGDRQTAASIAVQKLTADPMIDPVVNKVVPIEDVIETSIPTIMKTPLDVKPEIGIMGTVNTNQARNNAIKAIEDFEKLNVLKVDRLSDNEVLTAANSFRESITGLYPEHSILDVKASKENDILVGKIILGQKTTGSGYASEEVARNATEGLDVTIHKTPDGTFFPVHTLPIKETGATTPISFEGTSVVIKNALGRTLAHPAEYLPDHLLEDLGLAVNSRTAIRREHINPLLKDYIKIPSKSEYKTVNTIAALGRDTVINDKGQTGKWFTPEEFKVHYERLTGKEPRDKALKSYQAYRKLNDLQYYVENHNEFIRKSRQGFVEVSTDLPEFNFKGNGIIKDTQNVLDTHDVFIPSESKMVGKGDLKANGILDKYKEYKVIQLENVHQLDDGSYVKYLLMRPEDFKANVIDIIQVPYREGGRIIYAGKYFSKQAFTTLGKDGEVIFHNPLTHYTAETRQELVIHTSRLENARNAYKSFLENKNYSETIGINKDGTFKYRDTGKPITEKELDSILSKTSLVDKQGISRAIEDHKFSLDHPLEVRNDKELPTAYNNAVRSYADENVSGATTWLATNNRKKFAARGDRLLNPQEQYAKVLDPHEAIQKSVQSIMNYGVAGNYTSRISEQFAATAKALGFLKPEFKDASAAKIFSEGKNAIQPSITGVADTEYQGLLATLETMQRGLGYKSTTSLIKDATVKQFAEFVESNGGSLNAPSVGRKITTDAINLGHKDPLQAGNTFLYYTQFGLNAMQFVTQGLLGGYVTSALQSPVKATQALMGSLIHAQYFFREDIAHAQSFNKPLMNLLGFKDGKEFISYLDHLKNSGYVNVVNTQVDFARRKMLTGKHGTAFDLIDKAVDKSTIALETGEMLNQLITYRIAYMRFAEQFPKVDINTARSTGWIIREADKIGVQMKSAAQRELTANPISSILLRYKNFFMNILEANTIGGKRTASEKAAFWAGSTAMFGLGVSPFSEYLKAKFGITDKKTLEGIDNGFVNYLLSNKEGDSPVDLSAAIDPRGGISSITKLMTDGVNFTNTPLVNKLKQVYDKSGNALLYLAQMTQEPDQSITLTKDALEEIASVTNAWNNYSRGAYALRTAQLYSNSGMKLSDNVPTSAAIATILGGKSSYETNAYNPLELLKNRAQEINDRADAAYHFLLKAEQIDRTTAAGRKEYDINTRIGQSFLDHPDSSDIQFKLMQKFKYGGRVMEETNTQKLELQRERRIDYNKGNK